MKENTREISILKKRILEYLDSKGVSKYECYKNTGITNGVLSQSNGLSEDNLMRFLSYYTDISYSWLFTGSGSMLRDSETSKEKIIDYSSEKIQSPSSDAICLRLMDKLDEKDNVIREKDVQITHIQFELRRQSEELATLKAQITHLQNEKDTARQKFPDVIEDFTSELSGDYGENSSLTRKSTILGMSSEERI